MRSPLARILCVEDDTDTCELVTLVLTDKGFEVITAETCDQALHLAKTQHFDLYILDNWLPDGLGIDLCARLRESDSQTPILFYSGAAYQTDKESALSSGAQGYLTKPTGLDELTAEVFCLIAASQKTKSRRIRYSCDSKFPTANRESTYQMLASLQCNEDEASKD